MKLHAQYLAGFFDGEGSIVIGKRHIKLAGGGKAPWYVLVVCLVNTHLPIMQAVQAQFVRGRKKLYEGHGATLKPKVKAQRNCYMMHLASDQAEKFLRGIYPHMIVKKREAGLAFRFRDHVRKHRFEHMRSEGGRSGWMQSDLYKKIQAEREAMYLEMRALKRQEF